MGENCACVSAWADACLRRRYGDDGFGTEEVCECVCHYAGQDEDDDVPEAARG